MKAEDFFDHLVQRYTAHSNKERSEGMKAYMKNQFDFFGIQSPERRLLSSQSIRELGLPTDAELKRLCMMCFEHPCREMQYFVQDVLKPLAKKRLQSDWIFIIERLVLTKSWWDTVDFLSPKIAGHILLRNLDQQAFWHERWISSENVWLNRSAILLQLDYKTNTHAELLFSHVLRTKDSNEFFVQKASGWALRQYARVAPLKVGTFLETNPDLPPLTRREASKHLSS